MYIYIYMYIYNLIGPNRDSETIKLRLFRRLLLLPCFRSRKRVLRDRTVNRRMRSVRQRPCGGARAADLQV